MSITPMSNPMVASPRPNSPWQLVAPVSCTNATGVMAWPSVTDHGTTGFSGIYESKRLDPGSFAGGLT